MKNLLIGAVLFCFFIACNKRTGNDNEERNDEAGNVEQHSDENISPQLEPQGEDRLKVDTISSPQ